MDGVKRVEVHEDLSARTAPEAPLPHVAAQDAARQRRLAALKAAEGLWKDRADIPKDGVQSQEEMRAEWH